MSRRIEREVERAALERAPASENFQASENSHSVEALLRSEIRAVALALKARRGNKGGADSIAGFSNDGEAQAARWLVYALKACAENTRKKEPETPAELSDLSVRRLRELSRLDQDQ